MPQVKLITMNLRQDMSKSYNNLFEYFLYKVLRGRDRSAKPFGNKPEFTKIVFQIFVNSGLFPKGLLLFPPFIRVLSVWQKCPLLLSHTLYLRINDGQKSGSSAISQKTITIKSILFASYSNCSNLNNFGFNRFYLRYF
ncbi:hypothetical protein ABH902_002202 [Enterococcus sp. UD-01]|jgi:hypothetical protein